MAEKSRRCCTPVWREASRERIRALVVACDQPASCRRYNAAVSACAHVDACEQSPSTFVLIKARFVTLGIATPQYSAGPTDSRRSVHAPSVSGETRTSRVSKQGGTQSATQKNARQKVGAASASPRKSAQDAKNVKIVCTSTRRCASKVILLGVENLHIAEKAPRPSHRRPAAVGRYSGYNHCADPPTCHPSYLRLCPIFFLALNIF